MKAKAFMSPKNRIMKTCNTCRREASLNGTMPSQEPTIKLTGKQLLVRGKIHNCKRQYN